MRAALVVSDSRYVISPFLLILQTSQICGLYKLTWVRGFIHLDSEMALCDGSSDCQLQFDEPDNSFSLSTDCNMIGGWFGTHKLHHPFKKHTRHRDGLRQYDC